MSRTEAELRAQLSLASGMASSEAKQAAMQDVVRHADAGGFGRLAFDARRRLASAYQVDRQWDKAFPLFSRCLSDHDQHPGDFSPEEELELREWYAFMVTSMAEFPEVTLDQIRSALDDVERRYRGGGHSLRDVYSTRRWVAQVTGDWDEEERCYRLWQAAGGPSSGSVWDFENEVERLVLRGDQASLARARQLTAPVLAGHMSFDEPPFPIQCLMLMPLARAGDLESAAAAYRGARREQYQGPGVYRYEYSGMLHEFCALTGNEYQGLADLRARVLGFWTLNRPHGKMEYATSVALLCRSLAAVGGGHCTVRGAEEGRLVFTGVLAREARRIALDLAARFDRRNGNTWQGDRIRARLAAVPVVSEQLKLRPDAQLRLRLPPVPPGLPPEQLMAWAQWHAERGEHGAGWQYLAALADLGDPPPELAGHVAYLHARMTWGKEPEVEVFLRQAADAYLRAGDLVRHLVTLCWLGDWHGSHGDPAQAAAILNAAVPRLRQTADSRSLAIPELAYAIHLRKTGRHRDAWAVLQGALQHARSAGDPLAAGKVALTGASWRIASEPRPKADLADCARQFFLTAQAPVLIVDALEALRRTYAKAGAMRQFNLLVDAELARLPPDTAPHLLGYLRIRRGLRLVAAGQAAQAAADLAWGVAEARTRDAVKADQVFYLAVALHAAGRPGEAAAELDGVIPWLDNLRGLGRLTKPDLPERARALLARCHGLASGYGSGAARQPPGTG